ncbi:protein PLASTID REDOX INSENSITIVE 2, chloroplastic-like [Rhododendron vialii]|uniref:protein PLASTID REDOX INSENSITIVE 2, chloroplastic-like n=1 Tax=Rhododendron vialii TaxID=182163 RepID=UPI00265F378D|nr:protein PLASTID REDOX INSENSITIVE 2, chloroplastic-like [Rhododendron vialii]
MASATSLFPLTFKSYSLASSLPVNPSLSLSSSSSSSPSSSRVSAHISNRHNAYCSKGISFNGSNSYPCSLGEKRRSLCPSRLICRAAEYKFPDPIPEFADAETEKFRVNLVKKLSKKKDLYGDSLAEVVGICTEIFSTFLHTEYGGPGTLLVIPFMDMAETLNERGLPGGPQAARAAVKWAQDQVDKDWKEWTKGNSKT